VKVIVQGQGEVSLTQKEFVASGGQGSIYARGTTSYKVYHDPNVMPPTGKITELAAIRDPNVIKPERLLLDPKKNTPIGYSMRFIRDAMPLVQVFTRAFREREGLDHPKMLALVRSLQNLVTHVHQSGILIVDLNEMNFLVDTAFREVYGIDVDSYQTRSYPATAIMPSVRDWTVKGHDFTELSDWFSFACVAFQMFTGIHPFKGKHATVHGLEERMKAGISIFDPSVSVPKVVYPVDVIPPGYRAWFKAVLQDGQRLPPPVDPGTFVATAVLVRTILSGASLDINELAAFTAQVLGYIENGGAVVTGTTEGVFLNGRKVLGPTPVRGVGFSPKLNQPIVSWLENGELRLYNMAQQKDVPVTLKADQVMAYGGRIYVKSADRIVEMVLTDSGSNVVASPRVAANILEHASRLHDGVLVQNLLGSMFVSVFPAAGMAHQVRVPELDGYKVVEAKFDNRLLMVIGAKKGKYDRLTFIFDESYQTYRMRPVVPDITPAGLNFVVLDNGICVHLNEEEKLEVSSVGSDKIRVVESTELGNDMHLVKHGGKVAFVRGDKVYSMRLK
jgi:hypothetical protein